MLVALENRVGGMKKISVRCDRVKRPKIYAVTLKGAAKLVEQTGYHVVEGTV